MKCPECQKQVKETKLNSHCKKMHGIYYVLSEETYSNIIERYSCKHSIDHIFKCPSCNVIKITLKGLANHYALCHAKDVEVNFKKKRNKRKRVKGKLSNNSMFKSNFKSGWGVQGGAPGLGKR